MNMLWAILKPKKSLEIGQIREKYDTENHPWGKGETTYIHIEDMKDGWIKYRYIVFSSGRYNILNNIGPNVAKKSDGYKWFYPTVVSNNLEEFLQEINKNFDAHQQTKS
jgi:hypothetical protein